MTWSHASIGTPVLVQDWITNHERRLNRIEAVSQGAGRPPWEPAKVGGKFRIDGSGTPGWRKLADGRIELRGRLWRTDDGTTPVPTANGDVLLELPYLCAPPNNKQQPPSSVSTLAPCNASGASPGVYRVEVVRGPWLEDASGECISVTQVIARPPQSTPIVGWVALDHVVYDPNLYLDSLPPVPYGEKPLVPSPGTVVVELADGSLMEFPAGIRREQV
jgi:hypothetical protein